MGDVPANPRLGLDAVNHLLGNCGVTFFATPDFFSEAIARWSEGSHGTSVA